MEVKERFIEIDGLRGICALMVVFSHYIVAFFPGAYFGERFPSHMRFNFDYYLSQSPLSLVYAGNFAVFIFLTISGLSLSKAFYNNEGDISKLATERYFRLSIPIFVSTLIIGILMKFSMFYSTEASVITGSSEWLKTAYDFQVNIKEMLKVTLFDVFFIGNCKYNVVFWMMSILFYGSFLTLAIISIWGKIKKRIIIYIIILIILCKLNQLYYTPFVFGIICTDLATNYKNILNTISQKNINIIIIILGMYLGSYPTDMIPTNALYSWFYIGPVSSALYHSLGAFMLIIGIMSSIKIKKILSHKYFQYLGKISFSIFLVHIIIICSFSCYTFIKIYNAVHKYQVSVAITFIPSMIIIIICAHLFYKFVEKSSTKITNKMSKIFLGDK